MKEAQYATLQGDHSEPKCTVRKIDVLRFLIRKNKNIPKRQMLVYAL